MKNNKKNLISIILIIVMILGFYFVLSSIKGVQDEVRKISSSESGVIGATVTPGSKATSTDQESNEQENLEADEIPTAILFTSQSSPLLEPQTELTIVLETVEKMENGIVNANIKVFTNNAQSYSALQPNNLFEIVNISDENQKPLRITGSFDSMPPQSAVTGQVTFKIDQRTDEIILQVQTKDGFKHYKFNFENLTYEEAILG